MNKMFRGADQDRDADDGDDDDDKGVEMTN